MSRTGVSAAIPARERPDLLREAIASVIKQTQPPDEIVVVDSGAGPDVRDVCASFGGDVRYFHQDEQDGTGAGKRIRAVRESRCEWVALLDQDDRWRARKLERQREALEEHPDVVAVFSGVSTIDASGATVERVNGSARVRRLSWHDGLHRLLGRAQFPQSTALVRRDAYLHCARRDPELLGCAEWAMWLELARERGAFAVLEEGLTEYRISDGQLTQDKLWLADMMRRVVERQRHRLEPDCPQCRSAWRHGREYVAAIYRVAARQRLDRYHQEVGAGRMRAAGAALRDALRASPREVLMPLERPAAIVVNALRAAPGARRPPAA